MTNNLPFGKIKDENVVTYDDGILYAHTKLGDGRLTWEGYREDQFQLVRKSGDGKETTDVDKGTAKKILNFLSGGYWDYAE